MEEKAHICETMDKEGMEEFLKTPKGQKFKRMVEELMKSKSSQNSAQDE